MAKLMNQPKKICDLQEVDKMQNDFLKKHPMGCPYHALIAHLNSFSNVTSPDKLLPVRKVVKEIYALGGSAISHVKNRVNKYLPQPMSIKSSAKTMKHIYDILFIEQEIYPILHEAIVTNQYQNFSSLYPRKSRAPLERLEVRREAGDAIIELFMSVMGNCLQKWQQDKLPPTDDFLSATKLAVDYSTLSKGEQASFSTVYYQGVGDAIHLLWALIYYIPELFSKKHNRLPTRDEYRSIVMTNIDKVLLPTASLNMYALTHGLRSDSIDIHVLGLVDGIGISLDTHTLGDDNGIMLDQSYLSSVLHTMKGEARDIAPLHAIPSDSPFSGWFLRTGCPALNSVAPDGKRVAEHFLHDCLSLFDKVYFPHWNSNI